MEFLKQWFSKPKINIGFEDIKYAIQNKSHYLIINTLDENEQDCLIIGTLSYHSEEKTINRYIEESKPVCIIVYGKNATDESVEKKRAQLISLGFSQVYIYTGGLFEWLHLQDIYGLSEFPTTIVCKDILKYKPAPVMPRFSAIAITY